MCATAPCASGGIKMATIAIVGAGLGGVLAAYEIKARALGKAY